MGVGDGDGLGEGEGEGDGLGEGDGVSDGSPSGNGLGAWLGFDASWPDDVEAEGPPGKARAGHADDGEAADAKPEDGRGQAEGPDGVPSARDCRADHAPDGPAKR